MSELRFRGRRKWTEADKERLIGMALAGVRAHVIARRLERSLASITAKAVKLGISLVHKDYNDV